MSLRLYITAVRFKNGLYVKVSGTGIVVVVGPNNSGKSTFLRDIHHKLTGVGAAIIVDEIDVEKEGDISELKTYYERFKEARGRFKVDGLHTISARELEEQWKSETFRPGDISYGFVSYLTTGVRLSDCRPAKNVDRLAGEANDHPIQELYFDEVLENVVSGKFRSAFGKDLVIHRMAGSSIPVFVGDRPVLSLGEQVNHRSYSDKIAMLERIEDQGDGFKSFASLLLRVWSGSRPV